MVQEKQSGPVDVMVDGVNYHGKWQLSGKQLKVSYGSWEEQASVEDASTVEERAKHLLAEIVDRDLTYRGRAPKD